MPLLKIKSVALCAACAVFALAANAETHSANSIDGFAELNLNYGTFDYPGNDWDEEYNPWLGYGLDAAVRYDLSSTLSVMFDLQTFTMSNTTVPDDEYTVYGNMIAAHINWAMNGGSVGAFAGVLETNEWYSQPDDSTSNTLLGLQGQWMLANDVIVDGEIASIEQTDGYYGMGTVTNTHLGAKYFLQDNLFVGASLGLMSGQLGDDEGEDVSATSWKIETGYQPDQWPVGIFANVSGMNEKDWWGDDAEGVMRTSIGVRYAFGGGSLKSQSMRYNQVADLSAFSWLRNDGAW